MSRTDQTESGLPQGQPTESSSSANPNRAVDERGRWLARSDGEQKAWAEALATGLQALATISDATDTEETWKAVEGGIDASRPHRPLFGSAQ